MLPVSLIFIISDPFSDPRKSKAQTTDAQEPRPCLQIHFTKMNYFKEDEGGRRRRKDGHQFFFTPGWKGRFAQKLQYAKVVSVFRARDCGRLRLSPRKCVFRGVEINYFPNGRRTDERTSVFLHYRMERALRAKIEMNT